MEPTLLFFLADFGGQWGLGEGDCPHFVASFQEGKKKARCRPDGTERKRDKRVRVAREKRERSLAENGKNTGKR